MFKFTASATIDARDAGTNRHLHCGANHSAVSRWAFEPTREALIAHELCARFEDELDAVLPIDSTEIRCFRGQALAVNSEPPPLDRLGPPPTEYVVEGGRYNRPGNSVLYLSDTEEGVQRELAEREGEFEIWMLRFLVRTTDLRLADFTHFDPDHFLTAVFWHAERAETELYPTFVFSQTVAEIVARRFDGMIVLGVRGENGFNYRNVVIFRPHALWRNWVYASSQVKLS
jgi:hypothetical protein